MIEMTPGWILRVDLQPENGCLELTETSLTKRQVPGSMKVTIDGLGSAPNEPPDISYKA